MVPCAVKGLNREAGQKNTSKRARLDGKLELARALSTLAPHTAHIGSSLAQRPANIGDGDFGAVIGFVGGGLWPELGCP